MTVKRSSVKLGVSLVGQEDIVEAELWRLGRNQDLVETHQADVGICQRRSGVRCRGQEDGLRPLGRAQGAEGGHQAHVAVGDDAPRAGLEAAVGAAHGERPGPAWRVRQAEERQHHDGEA